MIGALMLLVMQSAPGPSAEELRHIDVGRANLLIVDKVVVAARERNAQEFARYVAADARSVDAAGVVKRLEVSTLQRLGARCYDSRRVMFPLPEPHKVTVYWKCPGENSSMTTMVIQNSKVVSAVTGPTIVLVRPLESGGSR